MKYNLFLAHFIFHFIYWLLLYFTQASALSEYVRLDQQPYSIDQLHYGVKLDENPKWPVKNFADYYKYPKNSKATVPVLSLVDLDYLLDVLSENVMPSEHQAYEGLDDGTNNFEDMANDYIYDKQWLNQPVVLEESKKEFNSNLKDINKEALVNLMVNYLLNETPKDDKDKSKNTNIADLQSKIFAKPKTSQNDSNKLEKASTKTTETQVGQKEFPMLRPYFEVNKQEKKLSAPEAYLPKNVKNDEEASLKKLKLSHSTLNKHKRQNQDILKQQLNALRVRRKLIM